MTSKEAKTHIVDTINGDMVKEYFISEIMPIIEKDLELLEQLEILKKYYPPFKEFLEEMFEKGYNEDLTKVKGWLENE